MSTRSALAATGDLNLSLILHMALLRIIPSHDVLASPCDEQGDGTVEGFEVEESMEGQWVFCMEGVEE